MKHLFSVTLLALLCAQVCAQQPETAISPNVTPALIVKSEANYKDTAILPYVSTTLNADLIKATWETTRDLFVSKGYRVIPLDKTLAAMREVEVFPTMFVQIQREVGASEGSRVGAKQIIGNVASSANWQDGAIRLCKALNVSRIILAQVDSKKVSHKRNFLVSLATAGLLGKTKQVEVELQASAYGAKTGAQIWWASDKDVKKAQQILFFAPRTSKMANPALERSITRVFASIFEQDKMAYGSIGLDVKVGSIKAEKDGMSGIRLSWEKSTDTRVAGYAIYRGISNEDFDPSPIARVKETSYLDDAKGLTPATTYRYKMTAYSEADGESDPSEEFKCKF